MQNVIGTAAKSIEASELTRLMHEAACEAGRTPMASSLRRWLFGEGGAPVRGTPGQRCALRTWLLDRGTDQIDDPGREARLVSAAETDDLAVMVATAYAEVARTAILTGILNRREAKSERQVKAAKVISMAAYRARDR